MSDYGDWSRALKKTEASSDFEKRISEESAEDRIARISSNPKAAYSEPVKKNYPVTEMHYIICADVDNANMSMPEAEEIYGQPHKLGGLLLTDRLHDPFGWYRFKPGASIETIKELFPELYVHLRDVEKRDTF